MSAERHRVTRLVAALAVALACPPARAEPTKADRALATQLFQDGRALLEKKDFAAACPKFEESQRLDPGGGTLLNLAICHRGEGKLATAWTELNEALGLARRDGRDDRIALATQQIAAVEPKISRLTLVVPPASDLPELELQRDGTAVGRAAWGTPIPLDPGEHVVVASAPGRIPWEQRFTITDEPSRPSVEVPVLELAPAPPIASSAAVAVPPIVTPPAPHPDLPPLPRPARVDGPSRSAMRVASVVTLTAGGAGLVAGAITGGLAIAKHAESDAKCTPVCTPDAYDLDDAAKPLADASTAAIVLGLASALTGVVLFAVSAPDAPSPRPTVRIRGGLGTLGLALDL
ncbi:MAG: hypothetical protein U0414_30085 [Polyangiaceae bacterium]